MSVLGDNPSRLRSFGWGDNAMLIVFLSPSGDLGISLV